MLWGPRPIVGYDRESSYERRVVVLRLMVVSSASGPRVSAANNVRLEKGEPRGKGMDLSDGASEGGDGAWTPNTRSVAA